jgi:FkbM family methyltransferase
MRARLIALLGGSQRKGQAAGEAPSFRGELQQIVETVASSAERPEIRSAIRKGVSAEQWSAFLRAVLDALHPYDAITVLSEAEVTRPLEGIDETLLIYTGTRSANMRIQAASKEPWTYQWIKAAISPGEVLYDIGANVGGYSLIALSRGAKVVAFEPHHENFRELCRNVGLNKLEADAILVPVALSDQRGALRNPSFSGPAGQSMTLEEEGGGPVSIIAARLDDLRDDFQLPAPNHVKIDVDGFELKVLKGAQQTFGVQELRTCLIEIDLRAESPDEDRVASVCKFFAEHGFTAFAVTNQMAEGVNYLIAMREPSAPLKDALEQAGIGLKAAG